MYLSSSSPSERGPAISTDIAGPEAASVRDEANQTDSFSVLP